MKDNLYRKTVAEKTSVPQNFAERIYHLEYYFSLLINIKDGEEIGCEIMDDCHSYFEANDKTTLTQLKHTILTNAQDEPTNLTTKDDDLWHTIGNWIEMICDPAESRNEEKDQLEYIKNTSFALFTNKSTEKNPFNKLIGSKDTIIQIRATISSFLTKKGDTTLPEVDNHINSLLGKSDIWIEAFLGKISIKTISFDVLKENTLKAIQERFFCEYPMAINYYECYYSKLKDSVYIKAQTKKIKIGKQEFDSAFGACVKKHTTYRKHLVSSADKEIPGHIIQNLDDQIFIKQLKDLELELDVLQLTENRYSASNSFQRWAMDEVDIDDAQAFVEDKNTKWINTFQHIYNRKNIKRLSEANEAEKEEILIELGQECLSEIKKYSLVFGQTLLQTHVSNGHFYSMSDIPEIGWRYDWEEKYK